jgi:hypothetical protein
MTLLAMDRRYPDGESKLMPYYVGAGDPAWDEYLEESEIADFKEPVSLFNYVEPWQGNSSILRFAEAPGAEPELPQYRAHSQPSTPKRGFFASLFGRRPPVIQTPQLSTQQLVDIFERNQKAACAHALWKVSGSTASCRTAGVKRVFASYDGGGDESFTHLHGAEMNDGRTVGPDELRKISKATNFDELVNDAVSALMGSFGAGEFVLRGAVVVDFETCTITDEKSPDIVFGDKVVWRI